MELPRIIKNLIHLLLTIVVILFILSGYGITNYHLVESLTFGILSKPTSYQLHVNLILPLILLLGVHIIIPFLIKKQKRQSV